MGSLYAFDHLQSHAIRQPVPQVQQVTYITNVYSILHLFFSSCIKYVSVSAFCAPFGSCSGCHICLHFLFAWRGVSGIDMQSKQV